MGNEQKGMEQKADILGNFEASEKEEGAEFLEIEEILEGKTERSKEWLKGAEDQAKKKVMRITAVKKFPNGNMEMKGKRE